MKLSLCLAVCVLFVASGAMAVEMGVIETGGSATFHLSPEPWQLNANMYLLYYMSNMLGIGPFWSLTKTGTYDVGDDKIETPTFYTVGAMGKIYLPIALMQGKMTPFVSAGFGLTAITKFDDETKTESKGTIEAKVGFDYWLTDKWTVWGAFEADKLMVDKDKYGDMGDWNSSFRVGIATFIMK